MLSFTQAGVGPDAVVLGPDNPDILAVCSSVEALVRHRLKPATPRDGWNVLLPGRRSGPMAMLHVRGHPMIFDLATRK